MDHLVKSAVIGGSKQAAMELCVPNLINQPDNNGLTPLHHATLKGKWSLVNLFLTHRANPDQPEPVHGQTAVHMAVNGARYKVLDYARYKVLDYLIQHGADVGICDNTGNTALMLCSKKLSKQLLCLLLKSHSNISSIINQTNNRRHTALYQAIESQCPFPTSKNLIPCVKELIKYGADIHTPDRGGCCSPLLLALYFNKVDVIKLFAEWNCEFQPPDDIIMSPRHRNPWKVAMCLGGVRVGVCEAMWQGSCALESLYQLIRDPNLLSKHPQIAHCSEMTAWIEKTLRKMRECPTLQSLCKTAIRSAMGRGVPDKVASTGLPLILQTALTEINVVKINVNKVFLC